MALIGRFSRKEPQIDREPTLRDRDQILAYLEELFRIRTVVATKVDEASEVTYSGKVDQVNDEKGTFTITLQNRPSQEPAPGTIIHMYFTIDGFRFRTTARFLNRGGYMQSEFAIPEAILHAERRSQLRVRFGSRNPARAVVLQELFEGLGISGPIVNLSMGGINVRVDQVIDIRKDRRIKPRTELFAPGTPLALIRLQDLPMAPILECAGMIRHVDSRGEGIHLGIRLDSLGAFKIQALTRAIAQKVPGFGVGFPRKRRRGELESGEPESEDPEDEADILPLTEAEAALDDSEIEDLKEVIESPNRLAMLRRRSRHILLVAGDELERAILLGTLYVDGYRNMHEANGLVQALDQSRRHVLDAIILEQQVGKHSALEIIQQLRAAGRLSAAKVIVLKSTEDIKLKVAERAGGVDLIATHPIDFDGTLKQALERLLGIT